MKSISELKEKTITELERQLSESRAKLQDLRFRVSRRELKGVRDIRVLRRTIARVETLLHSRTQENKT